MDLEKIIRECVDKSLHMSLATVGGDRPWVSEVHFVYDDELNLYWLSKPFRRHSQEIAANANVAGNIVKQCGPGEPCGGAVYFEGTAKLIDDSATLQSILPLFVSRLGRSESIFEDTVKPEGDKLYKVSVGNWAAFGNFDGSRFKKFELPWNGGKSSRVAV